MPTTNTAIAIAIATAVAATVPAAATTADKAPGEPAVGPPTWETNCLRPRRSFQAVGYVAARDIKLRLVIMAFLVVSVMKRCTRPERKESLCIFVYYVR